VPATRKNDIDLLSQVQADSTLDITSSSWGICGGLDLHILLKTGPCNWHAWINVMESWLYQMGSGVGDFGSNNVIARHSSKWERHIEKTREESRLVQCYLLVCYTREWVKTDEKDILQHWTTIHYIQCLSPSHYSLYVNMPSDSPLMILHTTNETLMNTPTPHHPMSQYLNPFLHLIE